MPDYTKKPSKYPVYDSREHGCIYDWIIVEAQKLRAKQPKRDSSWFRSSSNLPKGE